MLSDLRSIYRVVKWRRVAIAGVVAMEPDFLVLDEPSAGLDPFGREEIFDEIIKLHKEKVWLSQCEKLGPELFD